MDIKEKTIARLKKKRKELKGDAFYLTRLHSLLASAELRGYYTPELRDKIIALSESFIDQAVDFADKEIEKLEEEK